MSTDDEALKAALDALPDTTRAQWRGCLTDNQKIVADTFTALGRALLAARRERDEMMAQQTEIEMEAQQRATRAEAEAAGLGPSRVANDAIGLFIEYRDQHGYDEPTARAKAVGEVIDAATIGAPLSAAVERVVEAAEAHTIEGGHPCGSGDKCASCRADVDLWDAVVALRAARAEGGKK